MVNRSSGNLRVRRRRALWFCGAAGLVALGWGALWASSERRFQAGLKQARSDIDASRFEAAGRWLAAQSAQRLGQPEAAFLVGICEDMAGRHESALDAWAACHWNLPGA